jgi:pimeloyl-ACP methyl ester carboxylesterase
MATFVLVHPAWFGGWCWKKVSPLLHARGHAVHTPTLTGLGERVHLARPEVGLDTHVDDVVNLLTYEDLHDVVLVGNSSGGVVITGVVDRVPERIGQLVYLDAFVPEDGQSMLDIIPPERRPVMEKLVQTEGHGWLLPSALRARTMGDLRARVLEDQRRDRPAVDAGPLAPTPFEHFRDPVRRRNPRAETVPRTYIRCVGWPNASFDRYAEAARRGAGWRYRELAASHIADVTQPRDVAELLLEAAS